MFNLLNSGAGTCIEKSIKYIHFNDKKPQYKNIFITNLKDKYAYVFDGDTFTHMYSMCKSPQSG